MHAPATTRYIARSINAEIRYGNETPWTCIQSATTSVAQGEREHVCLAEVEEIGVAFRRDLESLGGYEVATCGACVAEISGA